jgi:hypothetical protein
LLFKNYKKPQQSYLNVKRNFWGRKSMYKSTIIVNQLLVNQKRNYSGESVSLKSIRKEYSVGKRPEPLQSFRTLPDDMFLPDPF